MFAVHFTALGIIICSWLSVSTQLHSPAIASRVQLPYSDSIFLLVFLIFKFSKQDLIRILVQRITLLKFVQRTRQAKQQSKKVKANSSVKIKCTVLIMYDMAQPSSQKRIPLGIELFWDKLS